MNNKTFYTAYTNDKTKMVIVYAEKIKDAHSRARQYFGEGVSFTTREATHDETLHADPGQVLKVTR